MPLRASKQLVRRQDAFATHSSLGFSFLAGNKFGCDYGHDLTGFIDGTRNPGMTFCLLSADNLDHLLRAIVDEVAIFPDDVAGGERSPHVGGSFLWAGRFVHDLPKVRAFSMSFLSSASSTL